MSEQSTQPGWYPDPFGRHEHRWFDGTQWTEHVSSHGRQSVDPPGGGAPFPTVQRKTDKIVRDTQRAGAAGQAAWQGGTHLLDQPVLVVNQKAKLIEVNNEYAVFDRNGNQVGAVRQVGQSTAKKVLRVLASVDQFMTHKLQIVDATGGVVLQLTRPAKVFKSKFQIENGSGQQIGEVVQENMIGKIRFGLLVGGQRIGSVNGENWRAWNFAIRDHAENEVARITKTWEGLAKTMFTTADNYVVQIHNPLQEPLRSLVVAAALCVDTALKQDQRGFG
ncbi:MAG: phospholipid scramblase-related protein [Acidimicrobiales bacterium]